MLTKLLAAAAASLLTGALLGAAPARAANAGVDFRQACAPGYHPDRQGNCQPDIAQTDRFCPPGSVYHPAPDGWFCESSAGRAYYY